MIALRCWSRAVLMLCLTAVGGCTTAGIARIRFVDPSTANYRTEVELIENAQLVREDTSPSWMLGRYAFKQGVDRLLVVSRITSFEDLSGDRPRRYDKVLERVWIALPLGTQVGQLLKLEELEYQFLVGYDEGLLGEEMYVQPNRVLGKVRMIEEKPGAVVVAFDMRVEPARIPAWNYKEVVTVPVSPGVRAKRLPEEMELSRSLYDQRQEPPAIVPEIQPLMVEASGDARMSGTVSDTAVDSSVDSAIANQPGVSATQPAEDQEGQQRSIVGKWIGDSGTYEIRFQFDPDGRFVFSTCRSGYEPGRKMGVYKLKGNYVVMEVKKFIFGENKDHMRFLHDDPYIMLKFAWDGDLLVLSGNLRDREGRAGIDKLRYRRTYFPDMRKVIPPTRK